MWHWTGFVLVGREAAEEDGLNQGNSRSKSLRAVSSVGSPVAGASLKTFLQVIYPGSAPRMSQKRNGTQRGKGI